MSRVAFTSLPQDLAEVQCQIEEHARAYGLDFFPTVFEVVDWDEMQQIAAYGGFPTRYPHWRFGMEYEELAKGYQYGLQKIYELVINNDPCYAYLLSSNALIDQKMVMAHVYGHCDFFKNNQWFSHTNRKMMDEMANHARRVRRYMDRFGVEEVERFIDACLSIDDLIDVHSPFIRRQSPRPSPVAEEPDADDLPRAGKFQAKDYMDPYINPPQRLRVENERIRQRLEQTESHDPPEPMRDVMLYLLERAPLKNWQLDVLSIIRDEAYYFAPQGQTKIMNEGWASYWHSTIMTRKGLAPGEVIDYADHHSGTMATYGGRLNPYKLGIELLRDIEDRWNKGRFGPEYEACDDLATRRDWNTEAGLGRQKIFEVRRVHNDVTFIDEFLTLDFCRQHKLFSFGYQDDTDSYVIESREFPKIKQRLLFMLTNLGRPIIRVKDGNHKNRGELYLEHDYNGMELQLDEARDTLASLAQLWMRPVHIETVVEGAKTVLSFDGQEHSVRKIENPTRKK